ncbi:hypothetical protein GCM10009555_101820 [Acrocarpospora macrocephala]|uniref:AB hydrolase-1 domain-containing protein n=1 Tax=Acrocarpospora macrocephala TaxID=150177 RepID=A0A5M3WE44_9ACTN|nr:hypothetical protein Amac_007010 [Acrocarpospora macrocephala]
MWPLRATRFSVCQRTARARARHSPRPTPHPWLTYTEPLRLTGKGDQVLGAFIECTDWMRVFTPHAERAAARGWPVYELATGHEAMVTAPAELAELLLRAAAA